MIIIKEEKPTADQYNFLTNKVGWGVTDKGIIEIALDNTLYSVCAFDDGEIVGYARIIGDKTMFLYIQDVMVVPELQGQGIGSRLMEYILKEVYGLKAANPEIRTYLGASKGKEGFYRKFGFVSRNEADLGDAMILMQPRFRQNSNYL